MATRIIANVTYDGSKNVYGGYLESNRLSVKRSGESLTIALKGKGSLTGSTLRMPIKAAITLGGLITAVAQGHAESIEIQV